jgi:O-antigen/teichoic acid export membrane protein
MRTSNFFWHKILRYFSADIRKVTSDSFIVLVSHSFNLLYGFTLSYLSTRIFLPEVYGSYQFVLSILGMLGFLKLNGMTNALARDVNVHDKSPIIFTMRRYALFTSSISLLLILAIPLLLLWDRIELWPMFVVAAIFTPLDATVTTFFSAIITGKSQFKIALYYSLLLKTLQIIGLILIFTFFPSPTLLILLTFLLSIILYGNFLRKNVAQYDDGSAHNRIFSYGVQLSIATIPTIIVWYIDSMMIAALFGMSQLAMFSVALIVPEQFKQIFKELLSVTFSHQSRGKDTIQRRRNLLWYCTIGTIPFIFAIIAYYYAAPYIFEWIFPRYAGAEVLFMSRVAFATLIVMPWNLVPQYLEAQGYVDQVKYINIISSVLFAFCLITLIPLYGLIGAIFSRAILRCIYVFASLWYLCTIPLKYE